MFLVALNVVFVILGLACVVVGAIFKFGTNLAKEEVQKVLGEISTSVLGDLDMDGVLSSLAIVFLVLGIFILVVGLGGCIGACCELRPLLVVYAIIVAVLLIAKIVAIALFFNMKSDFTEVLDKGLTKLFDQYSTEPDDDTSRALDGLFHLMECCGYYNFSDITNRPDWNTPNSFKIPQGCCKKYNLDTKDVTTSEMIDCLNNPTTANSYQYTGCGQVIYQLFDQYTTIFIGIGITVLLMELLCVVFAFLVCCNVNRDKPV
ncbi:hypothetical protein ScPMuIL_002601 [Solemya velum]